MHTITAGRITLGCNSNESLEDHPVELNQKTLGLPRLIPNVTDRAFVHWQIGFRRAGWCCYRHRSQLYRLCSG